MRIIGITGTFGAGKGTIVDHLVRKGFAHFSAREFIAREIMKRGLSANRDVLIGVANDLRQTHSPGYIIEELLKDALLLGKDCVIESIRTEGEVRVLKKQGNFYLFAVDADPKIRYERIRKRGSETDMVAYDEFISREQLEMHSRDPAKQNLSRCRELADFIFENNSTVTNLTRAADRVLEKIFQSDSGKPT